jgi:hypothetical protein
VNRRRAENVERLDRAIAEGRTHCHLQLEREGDRARPRAPRRVRERPHPPQRFRVRVRGRRAPDEAARGARREDPHAPRQADRGRRAVTAR